MRAPEREDLVEKGDIWDWVPTVIAFVIIYAVLFVFYQAEPPLQPHHDGRR